MMSEAVRPQSPYLHTLREAVGIAIGEASMCWEQTPAGVFDSSRALDVANRLCERIEGETADLRRKYDAAIRFIQKWSEFNIEGDPDEQDEFDAELQAQLELARADQEST